MISNDAVCSVDAVLVLIAELARVWPYTSELLDLLEEGEEDIGVVVGTLVLDYGDKTLEAHAGIDVLRRKGLQ